MGDVKITSVYMLMEMLILISLYMKTCSIALLLVFPNLVTNVLLDYLPINTTMYRKSIRSELVITAKFD